MKKITTLILLFITNCSLLIVNAQSICFNKRISIPGGLELSRGIFPYKSGYLIAGNFQDPYTTIRYMFMSQIDSIGNLKWAQDYTTVGYDYFPGLSGSFIQTNDKHYAICGIRTPGPKGYGFLIKVDSVGNKKWEKEYQMSDDNNGFYSGNITIDSGYILTGYANAGTTRYQYLLLKADLNGNQQWYKTYTDNHSRRNYSGASVIQTPDKGYCFGGSGGYLDNGVFRAVIEIFKTDSMGNQEWKKTYGDPNYSNGGGKLCLSKDSCIIFTYGITTHYFSQNEDYRQPYIIKLGLNGSEKWSRKIANVQPMNGITWLQTIENGDFILSGGHAVKDTFYKNIGWLYKIKSNGDSLWYREYAFLQGPEDVNQLMQVKQTTDLGFVGVGTVYPKIGTGEQDIWVFKTDSMGCLVANCDVGITEFNPNAGAQMLIYPNPFKGAFAINYNIPKESKKAIFMLNDVFGKLVYQTELTKEVNQLQVMASALKPGVYIASLRLDNVKVFSEKIIKE